MSDHQNSVKMGFFPTKDYVIRDLNNINIDESVVSSEPFWGVNKKMIA